MTTAAETTTLDGLRAQLSGRMNRRAYPGATGERLARVKAHVDPLNLFHRNHNIAPAG